MKVFISWSGELSQRIAAVLDEYLPHFIQGIQTFFSPAIMRGDRWLDSLYGELEENSFGIFCLTPEALPSLWMSYEAGAIASRTRKAKVVPLLFGLSVRDLQETPYAPFMATPYNRREMLSLIRTINASMQNPRDASVLERTFDAFWPQLDDRLRAILPPDETDEIEIPRMYEQADVGELSNAVYHLLRKAKEVVLVGTGLCVLGADPLRRKLYERIDAGDCRAEIYLGNPYSPELQARLIEEETGKFPPAVGYRGLVDRIGSYLREWRQLARPEGLLLRVFGHYPTMATIRIDEHQFIYPYGHATLGNFSPVLHFRRREKEFLPLVKFLDSQHKLISERSVAMDDVARAMGGGSGMVPVERTHGVALYFVPRSDSHLYRFGSRVLGYDVHTGDDLEPSPWSDMVGEARRYGFHLTIGDALYFLNQADADLVRSEVEFLASQLTPFDLTDLRVEKRFPDPRSIAISCRDPSGRLEALHHEVVFRIYRRAAGSNYTYGITRRAAGSLTERDAFMVSRYRAPHVLSAFRPHFTLLSDIDAARMDEVHAAVAAAFAAEVPERKIEVSALALMSPAAGKAPYTIDQKLIRLG